MHGYKILQDAKVGRLFSRKKKRKINWKIRRVYTLLWNIAWLIVREMASRFEASVSRQSSHSLWYDHFCSLSNTIFNLENSQKPTMVIPITNWIWMLDAEGADEKREASMFRKEFSSAFWIRTLKGASGTRTELFYPKNMIFPRARSEKAISIHIDSCNTFGRYRKQLFLLVWIENVLKELPQMKARWQVMIELIVFNDCVPRRTVEYKYLLNGARRRRFF